MSIAAINEQLLRSIGVGVALVDDETFRLRFRNDAFAEWFGAGEEGAVLAEVVPDLDLDAIRSALDAGTRYMGEVSVKPRRRTLVISVAVSRATVGQDRVLVLECQNISRIRELESMIERRSAMVERNTREKERVERLLLNIMPRTVYEEFKTFGVVTPQLYRDVSVLMLDFKGFTTFTATHDPTVTLGELNDIFTAFDRIAEQYGCERIEAIGDAYLAVAGMPEPVPDHGRSVAHCATRLIRYLERRNEGHPHRWEARTGLGSGAAVGSVVGIQKHVYDVFGPAVNMASRLQEFAEPMSVVAPDSTKDALVEAFTLTDPGHREVRGLGDMRLIRVGHAIERPARRIV